MNYYVYLRLNIVIAYRITPIKTQSGAMSELRSQTCVASSSITYQSNRDDETCAMNFTQI